MAVGRDIFDLSLFKGRNFKMSNVLAAGLVLLPIYVALPALVLYFIIKLAVKNAIKELKRDNII